MYKIKFSKLPYCIRFSSTFKEINLVIMKTLQQKKITGFKLTAILLCIVGFQFGAHAQSLAVNTTGATAHPSALLDINSLNKGMLIPRISLTGINDVTTITAPQTSLIVYNTNAAIIGGSGLGYYYFDGIKWVKMIDDATPKTSWDIAGNAGTVDGINFLGTTDNVPLSFLVNSKPAGRIDPNGPVFFGYQAGNVNTALSNTGIGFQSLFSNTSGNRNTATGHSALYTNTTGNRNTANGDSALYKNTTGSVNTAYGYQTLYSNTTASSNNALGYRALYSNTNGHSNVAAGNQALYSNISGYSNIASGSNALYTNISGYYNVAIGEQALYSNNTGFYNSALGTNALYTNSSGNYNTANGGEALFSSTTADYNTAAGYRALFTNTTGIQNTAVGVSALYSNISTSYNSAFGNSALFSNSTGAENSAFGTQALYSNISGSYNTSTGVNSLYNSTGSYNTANGYIALITNNNGSYNTALGYDTGPNAGGYSNTTCVGSDATATASNMVRIGNVFVGSIGGFQNWTNISDGRTKEDIKENVPGLSFISLLRPVTYRLNRDKINEMSGLNERRKQITGSANTKTGISKFPAGDKYSDVTTGFIAQEVEASAKKLGFNFSGVDKPKNDKDFYGLRYAEFVVPLVKGMQEQQVIIENQNKRIENLEKMVKELNEKLK